MIGRFMRLRPGRYMLTVGEGDGPAGVHRAIGGDVHVDHRGGQATFLVPEEEEVYLWWRGPVEPTGVQIVDPDSGKPLAHNKIA